ncbi:MAG: hypothetical protein ACE5EM_08140 [Sphingomonadales bacterium]
MTYSIDCTGDICVGDVIEFTEGVFGGSYRRPKFLGDRTIRARVVKDSYGSARQQHTFTLEIIESTGLDPLKINTVTRRKGRNVYRNGTRRQPWADEAERQAALDEKHHRGDVARAEREERHANGF